MATNNLTGVPPVHPGRALESMRNSTFDTFSAIGELIDNSIEAGSRRICILFDQFDANKGKRGRPKIRTRLLAVGDNGTGMDADTMHRCLQLGYSTRYNERNGIGRFGVGMTLGSINQCKHIEVYSRKKGGDWLFAQLDLEAVEKAGDSASIAPPVRKLLPKEYAPLAGKDEGTVVVWKSIDRMQDNDVERFSHWAGRSYRKFIATRVLSDKQGSVPKLVKNPKRVEIMISTQGTQLEAVSTFDPLYAIPNVPNDPPAALTETIILPWEIDDEQVNTTKTGRTANISIRLSLLPPELRPMRNWGGTAEARRRHIHENLGFSILRNSREVYFGPWIGVLELSDESQGRLRDRYWGMEIDFPAVLDNQFQVRNIKAGAKPLAQIRESIEKAIIPTIKRFRRDIGEHWDDVEKDAEKAKPESTRKHGTAEAIAESARPEVIPATPKQTQELLDKLIPDIAKKTGEDGEREVTEWLNSSPTPYKIVESTNARPNGPFIDINPQGGKVVIIYTMKHRFFQLWSQHLAQLMDSEDEESPSSKRVMDSARGLKDLVDLLFISFAASYNNSLASDKEHAEPLLDFLIQHWSANLNLWSQKLASRG